MFGAIAELVKTAVGGVSGYFKRKQKIQEAVAENKARLAAAEHSHNATWELRSLENAGWKDEILFVAIISMYVYSAFDPDGAARVFRVWDETIPAWYREITFWLVASVLGVKKIGEYLPGAVSELRKAIKGE